MLAFPQVFATGKGLVSGLFNLSDLLRLFVFFVSLWASLPFGPALSSSSTRTQHQWRLGALRHLSFFLLLLPPPHHRMSDGRAVEYGAFHPRCFSQSYQRPTAQFSIDSILSLWPCCPLFSSRLALTPSMLSFLPCCVLAFSSCALLPLSLARLPPSLIVSYCLPFLLLPGLLCSLSFYAT